MIRPSYIYHRLHALLLIIGAVLLIMIIYNGDVKLLSYEGANLIILLSSVLAMHSQIYMFEEIYYDFNPTIGKNKIHNKPFIDYDNNEIDDTTGMQKDNAI